MASVYKYYAPTDNNRDAILNKYFWFSKAKVLNDPFDVCARVIELFPQFKNVLIGKYGDIENYYEKANDYAICCFTNDYLNKHMWALYANSYQGWCLDFDDVQIIDGAKTGVPPKFYEVHYVYNDLPDFNNPDTEINIETHLGSHKLKDFLKDPKDQEMLFAYLLSIKEGKIWGEETERRIFLGNVYYNIHKEIDRQDKGYKIPWNEGKLNGIIMGHNVSSSNKDFLLNVARERNLYLKQIKPIIPSFDFKLDVETIF